MNSWIICDIKSPPTSYDSKGQLTGSESTVLADVPCQIENLGGRDADSARQLFPSATVRVRLYGDPSTAIDTTMIVVEKHSSKRLHIGYVNDVYRNGTALELLCGEVPA